MTPAPNRAPGAETLRLSAPWAAFPPLGSVLPIVVGFLVLAGWYFNIESLKRVRPQFVAMNPMTACLFVLAGSVLGLSLRRTPSNPVQWIRKIGAVLILTIASAKLAELTFGWKIGVDQCLFADQLGGGDGALPNRMAPNTAVCFALIALSMLSLDFPVKRFSFSQAFALLAGVGALLSILGYAYGVKSFVGVASFIPMALHSAVTLLLLALGLFFAREATPWGQLFATPDAQGVVARRLFPTVIGLTLFLGWLRVAGERHGFYEGPFGTAVFVIILCLLFLVVVRWTVWTVGKIDAQRNSLQEQLFQKRWEVEESLQQTQLILDHARELICTLNARAEVVTVNAACDEILSLPSRRLLGCAFAQLHSGDEAPRIDKAFAVAKSGMTAETFTARCRKGDDTYAQLNWSIQWSPHFEKMFCVGRLA